jgi:hypothetical protein
MAKARLLQAVCTVAMLAAAPAFAQTDTQPGTTGAGNAVNAPAADDMSTSGATGTSQMSPASKMGSSSGTAMNGQSTHRSAMMGHSDHMMHGRTDTSQDAAVDQLNDQSYRAAQQGQAFSASNTGAGGMTAPGGSSRMNGMSSGPTSGTMGTDSAPSDMNGK